MWYIDSKCLRILTGGDCWVPNHVGFEVKIAKSLKPKSKFEKELEEKIEEEKKKKESKFGKLTKE